MTSDTLQDHPLSRGEVRDKDDVAPRPRWCGSLPWALVAIGAALLFVGYWGASDSTDPGRQLPYLASGTAPGLSLVLCGAALLIRTEHEKDRAEVRHLQARFDALLGWLESGPTAELSGPPPSEVPLGKDLDAPAGSVGPR